jgi:Predicted ATPase of the ABC class
MWSISTLSDPIELGVLVQASSSLDSLLPQSLTTPDDEELHVIRTAIADFFVRRITSFTDHIQTLENTLQRRGCRSRISTASIPYVLERSDFWCSPSHLHLMVRVCTSSTDEAIQTVQKTLLNLWSTDENLCMKHIACCILQHRLRNYLVNEKLVAFVANGSILPRKSGVSHAPMSAPPAVPFLSPSNTDLTRTININMGPWASFCGLQASYDGNISITGMAIPVGITLIVGGGYHGKSTLLRTIAAGVYNKIPGDGRELCVTVYDALTIRAEDGRYVNNCNISAFISNLPTLPGMKHAVDTKKFSTHEASGSTSQAANVADAIEMGASLMLVDEDVSAANFMARDGRMRALVMDESITPLLYRVNGMYSSLGISSIVVVGGVGDWLDVPHKVIMLDKYVASDATEKANSISRQFSYGHVQYAGRGVVHRLLWDKDGTPKPRRPTEKALNRFGSNVSVSLLEESDMLLLQRCSNIEADEDDSHEDLGYIDMSRCEQLLGRKGQLFGCGLCVAWMLEQSQKHPEYGIVQLINALQKQIKKNGIASLVDRRSILQNIGVALSPRKHEIFLAFTRIRGLEFEEQPVEEDVLEIEALREAERKKQELAEIWNSRRKTNRFS